MRNYISEDGFKEIFGVIVYLSIGEGRYGC